MKNSILVAVFCFAVFACSTGNKESKDEANERITPPSTVSAAFTRNFPQVTDLSWGEEDGQFEASFTEGDKEMSATFDDSGKLLEKETEIAVADLPVSVVSYLNDHYAGVPVKEAARIEKSDGTIRYEAEVNGKDLLFDDNSNFLQEESN